MSDSKYLTRKERELFISIYKDIFLNRKSTDFDGNFDDALFCLESDLKIHQKILDNDCYDFDVEIGGYSFNIKEFYQLRPHFMWRQKYNVQYVKNSVINYKSIDFKTLENVKEKVTGFYNGIFEMMDRDEKDESIRT